MSSFVIAIFLLSIGASFVQRTTGFGFGFFIMTMLPFFLSTYGEATTLIVMPQLNASHFYLQRYSLFPIIFVNLHQRLINVDSDTL